MEAPQKRLNRKQFEDAIANHVVENYKTGEVQGEKKGLCKKCDSVIKQVTCFVSIHDAGFTGCVGEGRVERVPLPFCPTCEGIPVNVHTCIHV